MMRMGGGKGGVPMVEGRGVVLMVSDWMEVWLKVVNIEVNGVAAMI